MAANRNTAKMALRLPVAQFPPDWCLGVLSQGEKMVNARASPFLGGGKTTICFCIGAHFDGYRCRALSNDGSAAQVEPRMREAVP
jgi:hypothetical protein